jgi:hypothetical protein
MWGKRAGGPDNMKLRLATAVALVASISGAALAQTPAEVDYCNRLAAYYDLYNRRGEGQIQAGGVDRVIGLERCRKGEVKDGTERLQRAIRAIGFDPPKP